MARSLDELPDEVENFAKALENRDCLQNVGAALNARMCCDGHMCGCQGTTVGEYLAYEVRWVLEGFRA